MAELEITMPKMGESIMEATILSWLKKPGDRIEEDESLLEVATDKVDTEIPSAYSGELKEILAKEGDVVKIGSPIAIVITNGEEKPNHQQQPAVPAEHIKKESYSGERTNGVQQAHKVTGKRFYSPLVRNIARQEAIPFEELERVPGTGKDGRLTKRDLLDYLRERGVGRPFVSSGGITQAYTPTPSVPVTVSEGDEIIQMDRMRKMIAERMIESRRISAHVTSFVEADMTNVVIWRNKMKRLFQEKYNDSLTYTPILIYATAKAIHDYPMINVQVDGDKIIRKKEVNIGLAVALPTGNLIVPVIRNADKLTVRELAQRVNDFARRARDNKLKAEELVGGTYTISNVGSFGNVMGTPIIVQPQVAIMAFGALQKKPAVIDTPYGDAIAIRHKMFLSHSYDHRVVDGALGGMMVRRVADYLEQFDTNLDLG